MKETKRSAISHKNLKAAHAALDSAHEECGEEEFERFSETARENARCILDSVCKKFPGYEYDIYPTEEWEIAVDCHFAKGRGILMLCDSKGSLAYFAAYDGKNSLFRCDDIDQFAREACRIFDEFDKKISAAAR